MNISTVSKLVFISNIKTWRSKGYNPLSMIRVLEIDGGTSIGIVSYVDNNVIFVAENMHRAFKTLSAARAVFNRIFSSIVWGSYEQR